MVGPSGETEVGGIGLDDHNGITEALAQVPRPAGVCLHCDHPSTSGDERGRDGSHARADIEDKCASGYGRLSDELIRPPGVELVPCPAPL